MNRCSSCTCLQACSYYKICLEGRVEQEEEIRQKENMNKPIENRINPKPAENTPKSKPKPRWRA